MSLSEGNRRGKKSGQKKESAAVHKELTTNHDPGMLRLLEKVR